MTMPYFYSSDCTLKREKDGEKSRIWLKSTYPLYPGDFVELADGVHKVVNVWKRVSLETGKEVI